MSDNEDELAKFRKMIAAAQKKNGIAKEKNEEETAKEESKPEQAAATETVAQDVKPITENSIWVGNLDQSVTKEKLEAHFGCCGTILKSTIKMRGPAKYAYIEFSKKEGVTLALKLNDSLLQGKNINVKPKRENEPGKSRRRSSRFRRQ